MAEKMFTPIENGLSGWKTQQSGHDRHRAERDQQLRYERGGDEDRNPDNHADRGQAETQVVAIAFADKAAQQRGHRRTRLMPM